MMLLHGDCLQLMHQIPDGSVDMILADLPYGTTACKWDNVIPFEPLWRHYWRVLKPNGAVVLFGSEPFSSHLRMSQIKHYKYDWVWDKVLPSGFQIAKYRPMQRHECISVFNRQSIYYPQKVSQKPRKGKVYTTSETSPLSQHDLQSRHYDSKYPQSIVQVYKREAKQHHPTQKPVALLEYLIKTYTLEGETVLDNTMGSGSTGVACVNTGRKFIGIEQDDKYFAIAQQRIAEAQSK